ncbi:hypothetical protein BDR06DRAFT_842282, partial [Suillus hirtellus]
LMGDIRHQYHKDPFYKKVLDSPKEFHNFVVEDGIMRIKLNDRTLICVPDIKLDDRKLQEVIISQAHSLLAHLGPRKTLTYLCDHVWWKT